MRAGYIDSASLMDVIGGFVFYRDCNDWDEWTRQSIYDATMLLIANFLELAPPPESKSIPDTPPLGNLYYCYDLILEKFQNVSKVGPQTATLEGDMLSARSEFNNWLITFERTDEIYRIIEKTTKEACYERWIDTAIKYAWPDHSSRNDGLFNKNQIELLSLIVGISQKKMKCLWDKTHIPSQVLKWSKGEDLDVDFELARDAYVASALLRGKFHESLASKTDLSYQNHPLRQHIVAELRKGNRHRIPEPLKFLVSIIVASAWKEKKPIKQVSLYAENAIKARQSCRLLQLDQRFFRYQKLDAEEAKKIAIDTAKELKFRIYPKIDEEIIDFTNMLTKGSIEYILNLWWLDLLGIGSDSILWHIEKRKSLGKRIMEKITLIDAPLGEMATEHSGRIIHTPPGLDFG